MFEDQAYLNGQSGTSRLDKFTHYMLVKCSVEVGLTMSQKVAIISLWAL